MFVGTKLLDLRMQVSSPRPAARPAPPTGHLLARTVDWRSGGIVILARARIYVRARAISFARGILKCLGNVIYMCLGAFLLVILAQFDFSVSSVSGVG